MEGLRVEVYDSIDEVNANQWNNLVDQSDRGTVFHTHGWLSAVERGTDLTPVHAVVSKGENPVAVFPNFLDEINVPVASSARGAIIPKRLSSLSPGSGGPVITIREWTCLDLLFDAVSEACDRLTLFHYLQAWSLDQVRYSRYLSDRGYESRVPACRFVIDLERDIEEIELEMDKSRRQSLRRAREQDHDVRHEPPTEETIDAFYPRYVRHVERVDDNPFPRSFFRALFEDLSEDVVVSTVLVDGRSVGSYLYLIDRNRSTVLHFLPAIDEEDFEYHPSELLHADMIRWAKKRDFRYYDLQATTSDFTDGVFRYKEAYGGRLLPIVVWEKEFSRIPRALYELGRKLREQ